ncbi:hypothetical protein DICVIV_08416 [Dictyocaulus viviparus]|uniref:G-protein coupled receptors family 1 profile domain-containing protein n=1 Tax=Dictyocaulus viviparus TaxID=29172 RepID=A0A0D8XLM0_DICVI|nr:hypothetical protein DICVIV_08416 [Dictyocaulus viviparus]
MGASHSDAIIQNIVRQCELLTQDASGHSLTASALILDEVNFMLDKYNASALIIMWLDNSTFMRRSEVDMSPSLTNETLRPFIESVTLATILLLLILFCVIGNSFVIAAIVCERDLRIRPQYYLIFSLAVADLILQSIYHVAMRKMRKKKKARFYLLFFLRKIRKTCKRKLDSIYYFSSGKSLKPANNL